MVIQKWMPIRGCSNYRVSNLGKVKRLKHRANGKRHTILKEKIVDIHLNRQGVMYVNLIDDNGKPKVFSLQKLVMDTFLEKGHVYYKIAPDEQQVIVVDKKTKEKQLVQQFNNRVDQFVRKDIYDRMVYKPQIFKTIKT
jgi:hypothetical protein